MSLTYFPLAEKRRTIFAGLATLLFLTLIAVGVMAKNGWLPSTDAVTGRKTGWFGKQLPKNASSSWNPLVAPLPTPTPQLSKEYIYAGSRLLAVEDANANAASFADVAVWRPSTRAWWVKGGAGGSEPVTQTWGLSTDKPVPGDYDGDGKADFAVFRPSTGEWFYLQSSDGGWGPVMSWGYSTDVRVPADYDGDGRTDRAVWRPSDGVWYIVRSSDGAGMYYYSEASTDIPAPADYDGDGRADAAVWRNSNQTFYSINSSNGGFAQVTMGQSSSEPVSADYDGDGRADYAIRNGATWTIRKSSDQTTYSTTPNGDLATDKPVPHDYDGDGKYDIAVWRESNGTWYINQTIPNGARIQVQWGMTGDVPVPGFYRR